MLIDEDAAYALLRAAIERAGGTNAYARKLGTSAAHISQVLKGSTYLNGKVAADLGLRRVKAFELIPLEKSPEQERYENERRAELQRNIDAGNLPHFDQGAGIRSVSPKNSGR